MRRPGPNCNALIGKDLSFRALIGHVPSCSTLVEQRSELQGADLDQGYYWASCPALTRQVRAEGLLLDTF